MPQIQMIPGVPQRPSFSSQLGASLGEGIGSGLSSTVTNYLENKKKFGSSLEKSLQQARKELPSIIKNYRATQEGNPEFLNETLSKVSTLLSKGVPLSAAYEVALETDIPGQGFEGGGGSQPQGSFGSIRDPIEAMLKQGNGGSNGGNGRLGDGLQLVEEGGFLEKFFNSPIGEALKQQFGDPLKQANIPRFLQGAVEGASNLGVSPLEVGEVEEVSESRKTGRESGETLAFMSAPLRMGAKLPFIQKIKGTGAYKSFLNIFKPKNVKELKAAVKQAETVAKEAKIDLSKIKAGDKLEAERFSKSLEQSQKPTSDRTSRVFQEREKFAPKKGVKLREEQLKNHPKYSAEMEVDARERVKSLAKQTPKSDKGLAGLNKRRELAQRQLVSMENSYQKAIARNRAIENEFSLASAELKNEIRPILEASREDVKLAESAYERTMSNARSGGTKKGAGLNARAAQEKLLKIKDKIADGETVNLSKMDYNPERVKEAKRVGKKKAPPGNAKDTFYEKVHDEYEKVYQKQLGKVEKELSGLKGNMKKLSDANKFRNLEKERDVLKKLIDQTKADKVLHRRKLQLRQIGERKKAAERFKSLAPKTKAQAQRVPAKSKEMIRSSGKGGEALKNPEKAAKKEFPNDPVKQKQMKDGIKAAKEETSKFSKAMKEANVSGTQAEAVKTGKEAVSRMEAFLRQTVKNPFWKRDVGIGIASAIFDDLKSELEVTFSQGAFISAMWGSTRRRFLRVFANNVTKTVIKKWRINEVKNAYLSKDSKKLQRLKKSYSPSMVKKGREKAYR